MRDDVVAFADAAREPSSQTGGLLVQVAVRQFHPTPIGRFKDQRDAIGIDIGAMREHVVQGHVAGRMRVIPFAEPLRAKLPKKHSGVSGEAEGSRAAARLDLQLFPARGQLQLVTIKRGLMASTNAVLQR